MINEQYTSLIQQLKDRKTELKLSNSDLAKLMNLPRPRVIRMLGSHSDSITTKNLLRLAKALNLSFTLNKN